MTWSGLLYGTNDANFDQLNALPEIGGKLAVRRIYGGTWPSAPTQAEIDCFNAGVIPLISFSGPDPATITSGSFDATLQSYFAASTQKKLVVYMHEADNGKTTSAEWAAAQTHIYNIKQQYCPNPDVLLGPILLAATYRGGTFTDWMVPGYMDFVGYDAYEFWRPTYSPTTATLSPPDPKTGNLGTKRSMSYLIGTLPSWCAANGNLPMVCGEYGAHPDCTDVGWRPSWLQECDTFWRANNQIASCYFHSPLGQSGPWWLDRFHTFTSSQTDPARNDGPSDPDSVQAFAAFLTPSAPAVTPPFECARYVQDSGNTSNVTVPITADIPAGSTILLAVNGAALNAATGYSVTDTQNNTWTQLAFTTATSPVNGQPGVMMCQVTTDLTTSDTLSVTSIGRSPGKWGVIGIAFGDLGNFDVTASSAGSGSVMTTGTTAAASQDAELLFNVFAFTSGASTVFTPEAGYDTVPIATASPSSAPKSLGITWAYVNAPGTRTGTATLDSAQAFAGIIVAVTQKQSVSPNSGSVTGSLTWSGSASGHATVMVPNVGYVDTGSLVWSGTASGSAPALPTLHGSATGTLHWEGAANGSVKHSGSAAGAFSWAGSATGHETPHGSATGSLAFTGSAVGSHVAHGSVSGSLAFTGSAAGHSPTVGQNHGSATGNLLWNGSVTGSSVHHGLSTATIEWAGQANGSFEASGRASAVLSWSGDATGRAPVVGASSGRSTGSLTWAGLAHGSTNHVGTALGLLVWAGSASGHAAAVAGAGGSATGSLVWNGVAIGSAVHKGTSNGAFTWSDSAVGHYVARGNGAGDLSWLGAARGTTPGLVHGSAIPNPVLVLKSPNPLLTLGG